MEFDLNKTLEVLSATPGVVRAMLGGLSDNWTTTNSRDDWGPFDIVGHLIHAEHTDWIPRARVILNQGSDRNFPPFDRFGHFEVVKGKHLNQLLDDFDAARCDCLQTLVSWKLSEGQLGFQGIHPEFGTVTLSHLLATWAVHDLTHIRQIATAMAKRYATAVGPWKEYLSVLK